MNKKVLFLTSDGHTVEVEREIASKSEWVKNIVDGSEVDDNIPLPGIKKATLLKVIEYCTYINTNVPPQIDKPLRSNELSDIVDPWYAEFVNLEQEVLFELILAANFMDIKSLLELACAKVASLMNGMTIPQVREYFNIENDFTAEEEVNIMYDDKWAEESF
jgi:S-phase kinase-associated protein 1